MFKTEISMEGANYVLGHESLKLNGKKNLIIIIL